MTSRCVYWGILAPPAIVIMQRYAVDALSYGEIIHETGDWSVRLLILTMAATPLRILFGNARWTGWLLRQRRALGVATFAYALLHTLVYAGQAYLRSGSRSLAGGCPISMISLIDLCWY